VAHAEGKFVAAEANWVEQLQESGQIVLQFVDSQGQPTQDYPANPNGSAGAVAGLCDATGQVFGLIPHPERHIDPLHHPQWTRRTDDRKEGDGLRIFRNAVRSLC
jgi:phosphoribosylformylglycinamidine synthase